MFKNLKLGFKIGGGFGILILIACVLGGIAVYNMGNVQKESTSLEKEYVPEIRIVSDLQNNYLNAKTNFINYALTHNEEFFHPTMERINKAEENVGQAKDLVHNYPDLVALKENIGEVDQHLNIYDELVGSLEGYVVQMSKARGNMD